MSKSSTCPKVRREYTKEGTEPGVVTVLADRGRKQAKTTAKTWPSLLFLLHSKLLLVNKFNAMLGCIQQAMAS
jgi:hypothetical protein